MLEISLGSGIAIGTVSISAATVIISVIKNKKPPNENGNGKFSQKLCDEKHKSLEGWMQGMDKKIDKLLNIHIKED